MCSDNWCCLLQDFHPHLISFYLSFYLFALWVLGVFYLFIDLFVLGVFIWFEIFNFFLGKFLMSNFRDFGIPFLWIYLYWLYIFFSTYHLVVQQILLFISLVFIDYFCGISSLLRQFVDESIPCQYFVQNHFSCGFRKVARINQAD